uniref:Uncharacterized protein n=1 Tax=Anguilla anguilla TaxID=7936 RepID=A0A0E9XHM1_ANGAN
MPDPRATSWGWCSQALQQCKLNGQPSCWLLSPSTMHGLEA